MTGPINERSRPACNGPAKTSLTNDDTATVPRYGRRPLVTTPPPRWTVARGHRLRRDAARRCEPLADGRRDPDEDLARIVLRCTPFGLTADQIEAERARLLRLGWSAREIATAFGEVTA